MLDQRLQKRLFILFLMIILGLSLVILVGRSYLQQLQIRPSPGAVTSDIAYPDIRNNIRSKLVALCSNLPNLSDCRNELDKNYSAGLLNKQIGWEGWIAQLYHEEKQNLYRIGVDMDGYDSVEDSPPLGFYYEGGRRIGLADVVLYDVSAAQAQDLAVGERVIFLGKIKGVAGDDKITIDFITGGLAVAVTDVEIVYADKTIEYTLSPKTIMTLTRPICAMFATKCYTYHLIVYGDGRVVYKNREWQSGTLEVRTLSISQEKTSEIFMAFKNINYFSLRDDYNSFDSSDMPSATTSITLGNIRKSIFDYYGDNSSPAKLIELADKIDEIVGIDQILK